jgi:hypothetical protein
VPARAAQTLLALLSAVGESLGLGRFVLPATKSPETNVIQSHTKGNAEKTPRDVVRYDRGANTAQEEYDGRDYIEEHPDGHV